MQVVGVDIIEIERVAQCCERFGARFLQRVYTSQELAYCNGRIASLAARWAAKEATAKALGSGIGAVNWREIEVISDCNQRPALHLHGTAAHLAAQIGVHTFAVSLSHSREYAVAFVVGE